MKRILQARDVYIKIKGIEREKELCVISMEVTVYRNNDEMRC